MPSHERVRLDNHKRTAPIEHPAQERYQPSGRIGRAMWFEFALLKGHQLLSEEQIPSRYRATGSSEEEHNPTELDQHFENRSEAVKEGQRAAG